MEGLTSDAAKAADEAAATLKAVTDENDALAAQVETLTADAAKAAEDAAASLKAVTDEKDALAAQIEDSQQFLKGCAFRSKSARHAAPFLPGIRPVHRRCGCR